MNKMSKWEDTVMSDEEATEYIKHFRNVKPNQKLPYHWHREAQAEISFKAGYDKGCREGIRKVQENAMLGGGER